MLSKEEAFQRISHLVQRFEEQYESYKKSDYNETQTRRDFIDPFFKALGWDIDNESGHAEAYREVIHEDKVIVAGTTKAPDYSFRLSGGKRLFFVEAKKPSVSVKEDIQPAYQIRRYGWSAKHPISIITDFEEFSVYDCTIKPDPSDKASVARIRFMTFREYLNEFDFIWETFSKEYVLKGSFDKFLQSTTLKKGTATVDKEFLQSLDNWRTYLATSISWNNKQLDEDEINYAVQQTIDRIIFLRIAEDRGVEPYGNLKHAIKQGDYYHNLFDQFRIADEKYNSGLFDISKDLITENLKIDNKVIRTIINELYYPECPYEFSVLSVEILGSAYEQFLGKVIRITPAHHAKIEEKPEVRKAGGVYYTPQYIVDYIVKSTVGKLIEGKTPSEISKIKIVDPACGSGSFLIGTYQYLLDFHKRYYTENLKPSKGKKDHPLTPDGHLTTSEKKRILINNIFGVDIDINAVEVTKLSLLLKCMEGETEVSIQQQLSLWHDRILPTLDNNIKDGNSLIDNDFYSSNIDFNQDKKIKPFSWFKAFPDIIKQGGFNVVIGNPPWGADFDKITINYIRNKYISARTGSFDSYSAFIERSLTILCPSGLLGFITPDTFLRKDDFFSFRSYILNYFSVLEIIETGPVFAQVRDTWCCLIFIQNRKPDSFSLINHKKISRFIVSAEQRLINFGLYHWDFHTIIPQDIWMKKNKMIIGYKASINEQNIIDKLEQYTPLGLHNLFSISRGEEGSKFNIKKSESSNFFMVIPADIEINLCKEGIPIDSSRLTPNKYNAIYTRPKIWITRIQKMRWERRIVSSVDERTNSAGMKTLQSIVSSGNNVSDLYFLQSILSSRLINFWCVNYLSDDMNQSYLSRIPIMIPQNEEEGDIKIKNDIVAAFGQMIQLIRDKQDLRLQAQINHVNNRIIHIEDLLNQYIYQLYHLNLEEIKIVEESYI